MVGRTAGREKLYPRGLDVVILFTAGISLFQQMKDKQLQDDESRDQDDSGNGADVDVQEH